MINNNRNHKHFLAGSKIQKKLTIKIKGLKSNLRSTTKTLTMRYASYVMRHGKKHKISLSLYKGFCDFLIIIFFENTVIDDYGDFVTNLNALNAFSLENLLSYLTVLLKPVFFLKTKKLDKRYRKKFKKKFLSRITYVKPNNRSKLALIALSNNIKMFTEQSIVDRVHSNFIDTVLGDKESYLYKRKLYMYSKILKKYKSAA